MAVDIDNQTWIVEAGSEVIEKRHARGKESLTTVECLIYCLWVADYGMTNAGDLKTARGVYESFREEGAVAAEKLSLPFTQAAFSLSAIKLEARYFELFDGICRKIRSLSPAD